MKKEGHMKSLSEKKQEKRQNLSEDEKITKKSTRGY